MTSQVQAPPGPGVGDVFGPALSAVRRELSDVVEAQTWTLDEARLDRRIADALAARACVDEVLSRLVAEADDRNLAKTHGASSTKAHLVHRYRMSGREAAKVVRTARALNGVSAVTNRRARLWPTVQCQPSRPWSSPRPSAPSPLRSRRSESRPPSRI